MRNLVHPRVFELENETKNPTPKQQWNLPRNFIAHFAPP